MNHYVDKSVQTTIAGLTRYPGLNPPVLTDVLSTPPEDMPTKELDVNDYEKVQLDNINMTREQLPPLLKRDSIPFAELDSQNPPSPPPTNALSPLPEANKLHAGHTPVPGHSPTILRSRSSSPLQLEEQRLEEQASSGSPTPDCDAGLEGPLALPVQIGDGSGDCIDLKALDAELEKIAKAQSSPNSPSPTAGPAEHSSRKSSTSEARRKSSADNDFEVVDGVILKKPRMNLGAPLGQV